MQPRTTFGSLLSPSKVLSSAAFLLAVTTSVGVWARERVLVCPFEGPRAAQLRWRVSSVVKKAGHTSVRYKAPPPNASDKRLTRYASRRIIDAFVFGTTAQDDDGSWTLRLTIKGPEAEIYDDSLVYQADTLKQLVRILKREGKVDLVEAVLPYEDEEEPSSSARAPKRPAPQQQEEEFAEENDDQGFDVDSGQSRRIPKARQNDSAGEIDDPAEDVLELNDPPIETRSLQTKAEAKDRSEEKSTNKRLRTLFAITSTPRKKTAKKKSKPLATNEWDVPEDDEIERDMDGGSTSLTLLSGMEADEISDGDLNQATSSSLLQLGVGAGFISRDLSYADNLYGRLRDQDTNVWVYQVRAELFPFAAPLNDRVSLIAGFESAMSGSVQDNETNAEYGIGFSEYFGGVRVQQPIGNHRIEAQSTIGNLTAGLDDPDNTSRVPEFSYSLLRTSLAVILDFGKVSVEGKAGYEMPLGYGEVGEAPWFPRIDGQGYEIGGGLQYALTSSWSLGFGSSLRRLNLDMNSRPEDAQAGSAEVAGGATDTYVSARASLTMKL